jgi:hypothetical protein
VEREHKLLGALSGKRNMQVRGDGTTGLLPIPTAGTEDGRDTYRCEKKRRMANENTKSKKIG